MSAGASGSDPGAPRPAGAGNADAAAFIIRISPTWPETGSDTGILNAVDAETALFHNPSPTFSSFVCSVNFTLGAIGAFDGSCATSAATYESAMFCRHARSHAADWPAPANAGTAVSSIATTAVAVAVRIGEFLRANYTGAASFFDDSRPATFLTSGTPRKPGPVMIGSTL